jgi:hypothetical protein
MNPGRLQRVQVLHADAVGHGGAAERHPPPHPGRGALQARVGDVGHCRLAGLLRGRLRSGDDLLSLAEQLPVVVALAWRWRTCNTRDWRYLNAPAGNHQFVPEDLMEDGTNSRISNAY